MKTWANRTVITYESAQWQAWSAPRPVSCCQTPDRVSSHSFTKQDLHSPLLGSEVGGRPRGGRCMQQPALRSCGVEADLRSWGPVCGQVNENCGGSSSGYRPGAKWPLGLCQGGDDICDLKAPFCFRTYQCRAFPPSLTLAQHTEAQMIVSQAPLYCRI